MLPTLIIFILTILLLILSVLFKPKLYIGTKSLETFWVVAVIGATLLVLSFLVSPKEIYTELTKSDGMSPIKLMVIFLSMTGLSVILDELGFFKQVSNFVLKKAQNSQIKIFIYLYITISILTIFTSNDIIILTFTPIIIYFSKHTKINPIPFLVAQFVAANTWSLMFIIGNPTNMYLATAFNIGFIAYFKVMFIPTLLGGITSFILLWLTFMHELKKPINIVDDPKAFVHNKFLVRLSLSHLIICTIFLTISSYIKIEMYMIALAFLLSNSICLVLYQTLRLQEYPAYFVNAFKRIPWNLLPFIISMFILVIGLNKYGVTSYLSEILNQFDPLYSYGITSFLFSNLLNNIPMSVLYVDIISHIPSHLNDTMIKAIYASIIGSNIGAYFTPIGALAGMMWMRMLKKEDVDFSFLKFISYGVKIAVPVLIVILIVLEFAT